MFWGDKNADEDCDDNAGYIKGDVADFESASGNKELN